MEENLSCLPIHAEPHRPLSGDACCNAAKGSDWAFEVKWGAERSIRFRHAAAGAGPPAGRARPGEIILYAFDLHYLDGRDLRRLPQRERRRLLEPLLEGRVGAIRLSEEVDADGEAFFNLACELGIEGIVAKHRARPYRSGKRPEWLKIKCVRRNNFAIVGFEPSTVPGAIGRLLLAARRNDSLVYVGGVGTGFTRQSSAKLRELLQQIPTKTPAIKLARKNAVFRRPMLAAEIEYRAWTQEGRPVIQGFTGQSG